MNHGINDKIKDLPKEKECKLCAIFGYLILISTYTVFIYILTRLS